MSGVKNRNLVARAAVLPWLCVALVACGPLADADRGEGAGADELKRALQPLVDEWRTENGVPGVALVVALRDAEPVAVAAGIADLEAELRMTGQELFDAGSIIQTFVAAALLQLVDEGKLDLDERVTQYLPAFSPGARITVRQLLSHTSGLPDLGDNAGNLEAFFREPGRRWSLAELLDLAAHMPASFEPGTAFHDTGTDFVVAAAILESVTGSDLASELRRRFFEPLGLRDTYVAGLEEVPQSFISGYLPCGHKLAPTIQAFHGDRVFCQWGGLDLDSTPGLQVATFNTGASGLVSGATDLLHWARALYAGQVLSPAMQQEMLTFDAVRGNRGLGSEQFLPPTGDVAWGARGDSLGVESILLYSPSQDVALLAFANAGDVGNLTYLTDSVLDVLTGMNAVEGPGERTVAELLVNLKDEDPAVRREAAAALGRKGTAAAEAAPVLIQLLADDSDWQVRQAAATAMGWTGPESLVADPLRAAALHDPHERVQWAAQLALSGLGE